MSEKSEERKAETTNKHEVTRIKTGRGPSNLPPVQTIPHHTKIGDEVLAALRGSRRTVTP